MYLLFILMSSYMFINFIILIYEDNFLFNICLDLRGSLE